MTYSSQTSGTSAVVLLSGGLDSMVSAALAREAGYTLYALTIDYGQRHRIELESAKQIAEQLECQRHVILPLDLRAFGGSALTDDISVPKTGVSGDIPVTYVPARNLVFLSLTLAWAEATQSRDVFIGVNALDYSGYPDCRPEFIASFTETARLGTKAGVEGQPFTVHTPLHNMTKAEIAAEAHRLELDTGMSWSCYDPTDKGFACGKCDSCRLRIKGFAEAGLEDGVIYAE
ncbi:7-cyano-7-deazaguanine synthase QueC [Pontixanthobacter sp.]|uniref:7-cyano-7-deazaguanine synthase QueC n=1 Tax=Pontixanthobacter sp. TaxID=2792078 RepID=UPI003C7D0B4C